MKTKILPILGIVTVGAALWSHESKRQKEFGELRRELFEIREERESKFVGLESRDPGESREAVSLWSQRGPDGLPELRKIAFESESVTARKNAKEAIAKITGQWGSQTDLVWRRSLEDAIGQGKPIMLMQLFGNLDEEFC